MTVSLLHNICTLYVHVHVSVYICAFMQVHRRPLQQTWCAMIEHDLLDLSIYQVSSNKDILFHKFLCIGKTVEYVGVLTTWQVLHVRKCHCVRVSRGYDREFLQSYNYIR